MFRHDIREKPVLYKEILKAISKRELLEDLCFCACRKDHLPGVYRCHSWQAALLRYLSGLRWLASFRSRRYASYTLCMVQWLCHRETVAQNLSAVRNLIRHNFCLSSMLCISSMQS